jgi:solute:Na+ symporter, SSS family
VPQLFEDRFPSWFAGVAFGAIAIGALVPAAIMSIAAANLFTRNIYRAYFEHGAAPAREAAVSKVVSLIVKAGALAFVLSLDKQNAINFQLLGGIWILQTAPAIVLGLYTRWFHRWALLAGWAAGMIYGTIAAYQQSSATTSHFGSSLDEIPGIGDKGYIAMAAVVLNLLVAVVLTFALRAGRAPEGVDGTTPDDYHADEGDPRVEALPELSAR